MRDRSNNYFIREVYNGSDGKDFQQDFCEYLTEVLENTRFEAMNDHQLFLQGGKKMLQEIIEEIKSE